MESNYLKWFLVVGIIIFVLFSLNNFREGFLLGKIEGQSIAYRYIKQHVSEEKAEEYLIEIGEKRK